MSQIHPVQVLLDDHQAIEEVLNVFEGKLVALPAQPLQTQWMAEAVQFFRYFAESCHCDKEEDLVFPCLRRGGAPERQDIGAEYLDWLEADLQTAEKGDHNAVERVRRQGLAYVRFLREHIARVNDLLRWVARQPASEVDMRQFWKGVSPEEFHRMDDDVYEAYLTLADELCATQAGDATERLLALMRQKICGVCVDRNPDGSCNRLAEDSCTLMVKLPLAAEAILKVDSKSIEPYLQSIRDNVCAICEWRDPDGSCARRRTDNCTLDSFLPLVVEAVEEYYGRALTAAAA